MQCVALAHHQNGLILLRWRPLAVNSPQYQRRVGVFVSDDGQTAVGGSLSLDVYLKEARIR